MACVDFHTLAVTEADTLWSFGEGRKIISMVPSVTMTTFTGNGVPQHVLTMVTEDNVQESTLGARHIIRMQTTHPQALVTPKWRKLLPCLSR
jgi:hypothetical protein